MGWGAGIVCSNSRALFVKWKLRIKNAACLTTGTSQFYIKKCQLCLSFPSYYVIEVKPLPWWGFPRDSGIKNPPANQEMWVQSLGWEDPLEKKMATHSSILAWEIPWTEEAGWLQPMGAQSRTWLSDYRTTTASMAQWDPKSTEVPSNILAWLMA